MIPFFNWLYHGIFLKVREKNKVGTYSWDVLKEVFVVDNIVSYYIFEDYFKVDEVLEIHKILNI